MPYPKPRVASNAIVLLFALRLLEAQPPIPFHAEQALRLCRRSRRMRRCTSVEKVVDLPDGAGVSAFRLQYIPLYSKRSCLGGITINSQTEVEPMRIIRYDKLVRDRIPETIRSSGKTCTTEVISDEADLRMIDAKLDEELTGSSNLQSGFLFSIPYCQQALYQ